MSETQDSRLVGPTERRDRLPRSSATFAPLVLVLMLLSAVEFGHAAQTQAPVQLELERTIPLPNVSGRIDHLVVDVAHQRLFVAELGNGSVDAVDLSSGETSRIGGLKEPQGLAYLPGRNELVVASAGDGTVRFFDASSLAPAGSVSLGDDADNVRVDPKAGQVVVGYGAGALAILDPAPRRSQPRKLQGQPVQRAPERTS
jgi:DNA-binding beta-propeller fold protein YncE